MGLWRNSFLLLPFGNVCNSREWKNKPAADKYDFFTGVISSVCTTGMLLISLFYWKLHEVSFFIFFKKKVSQWLQSSLILRWRVGCSVVFLPVFQTSNYTSDFCCCCFTFSCISCISRAKKKNNKKGFSTASSQFDGIFFQHPQGPS